MSKNIKSQYFDFQVHIPEMFHKCFIIFHEFQIFTIIVGYTGLKENSTKIMERDKAQIILCRPCLFFIVF